MLGVRIGIAIKIRKRDGFKRMLVGVGSLKVEDHLRKGFEIFVTYAKFLIRVP